MTHSHMRGDEQHCGISMKSAVSKRELPGFYAHVSTNEQPRGKINFVGNCIATYSSDPIFVVMTTVVIIIINIIF